MKEGKIIAYYGAPASFSHQVALLHFPDDSYQSFHDFDACLVAIKEEKADIAVLPIENSNAKSIVEAQRQLLKHAGGVVITDLLPHRIVHHLYSYGNLASIKTIRSKDVAFAQTSVWLDDNLPQALRDGGYSTSEAVKSLVGSEDLTLAAIGSEDAKIYKVPLLYSSIQTEPNITLFAVLKRGGPNCPNLHDISRCLIALDPNEESRIHELEAIAQEHGCFFTYNWVLPGLDGSPAAGIFEIGTRGVPARGSLQNIAAEVISSVGGAKFLGGFQNKTMESLLTGKLGPASTTIR